VDRARALTLVLLVSAFVPPSIARASEIDDYQHARDAYAAHDWARAVQAFEALVGSEPPSLHTPLLIEESRKYLAAAYVFAGRTDAARTQFERLLTADPEYELDASQFPEEVVQLFTSVRETMQHQAAEAADREALTTQLEQERERARRLLEIAESDVEASVETSRWLALVPFGAGQFQNGDDGLGWLFFATEALFGLGAFGTLVAHQAIASSFNPSDPSNGIRSESRGRVNDALLATEITNWTCAGLFAIFAIVGVLQAQLDFHSTRSFRTRHAVPDELRHDVDVSVGPGGLRLTF
jgi:hypothetical protein